MKKSKPTPEKLATGDTTNKPKSTTKKPRKAKQKIQTEVGALRLATPEEMIEQMEWEAKWEAKIERDAQSTISEIKRLMQPLHQFGYNIKDLEQLNTFEERYVSDAVLALEVRDKADKLKAAFEQHSPDDVFTLLSWLMVSSDIMQGYVRGHNTRADYFKASKDEAFKNAENMARVAAYQTIIQIKPDIEASAIKEKSKANGKKAKGVPKYSKRSPIRKKIIDEFVKAFEGKQLRRWNKQTAIKVLRDANFEVTEIKLKNGNGKMVSGVDVSITLDGQPHKQEYTDNSFHQLYKDRNKKQE